MTLTTLLYSQLPFIRFDNNETQRSHSTRFPTTPLHFTGKTKRIRKISVVRANVIDKEHEVFKPSFDEYLKAMETVKTRRDKRKTLSTQTQAPPASVIERDEVVRKKLDVKEGELGAKGSCPEGVRRNAGFREQGFSVKKVSKEEIHETSMPNLNQNEVVMKKLEFKVGEFGAKGSRPEGVRRNAETDFEFRERSFDMKRVSKDEGVERIMPNVSQGEAVLKKWTRKKPDSKDGQIDTEFREQRLTESNLDEVVKRWTRKKADGEEAEMGLRGYERSSISSKKYVKKPSRKGGNDGYDDVEIERAAFKSLEEFPDVCDQPRVSRVDMDERIQKLAKSLNGASIDTPEWNFSKMMRSAKIRFADFSIIRLIQILGNYGNWRQVLQVIEWMQARERFKSNRIRNIYTAALDALGKARRPVEALNMFHTMQQQMASYPDIVAYHCIAVTLGQAGHMRELFHVIDTMRSPPKKKLATGVLQKWDPRLEPDIIVYNAVLNACARQKNLEGAFWVLQQLKQQGLQPNSITYGLVMEVMLACEKYNLVHEFFKKMRKSFIPNSLTYKVLVNTLWKEGKIDEAILTVKEMEKRGIIGSAALYYDLARCLCSAGRHVEAIVQIEKICKVANKPLVVTYTGLIQASLDSGKIESVTYIFKHMHKYCSPNLVTYNIMLKGYLDHHMFDEAKQLFNKLLENGNHVTSKVDYGQVVLPDIHTFNLMLDACLVNQKWDDLEFVYMKMLQHGYYFNTKRHLTMILEACKAGKVNLLETTWKHLIEGDQIPPPPLVQEMFCMKLKQDNYDAAFSCLICLPSTESHKYSRISWVTRFKDDPKLFQEETLLRVIDRVNTLSIGNEEPNVILLNLMKSCKETLKQLKVEEFVML